MRVFVDLTRDEFTRLIDLAEAERRPTRQQAAVLVARGLPPQRENVTDAAKEAENSRQGLPAA
jgi:hypothetical protein